MPALSDIMLDRGCASHIEAIHGETITVLTGKYAGQKFTVVRETETDIQLSTELGEDPRAKRVIRFRDSAGVPALEAQAIIQTEDGKKWNAVRNPQDGFLSTDFELKEIVAGRDS